MTVVRVEKIKLDPRLTTCAEPPAVGIWENESDVRDYVAWLRAAYEDCKDTLAALVKSVGE